MKKLLLLLLVLPIGITGMAQENDTVAYDRFLAEAGVRVPLGRLAGKMGPSPELGLWYRTRIAHNDNLDLGLLFYLPTDKRHFDYVEADTLYRIRAQGLSGMLGIRFSKFHALPGNNKSLEWITTYGYGFFTYHDKPGELKDKNSPPQAHPEPRNKNEFEIKTYTKAFSTISIGQGIRLNMGRLGLLANYSYTPYGLFSRHVPKSFGSHSISFSLSYKPEF